MAKILVIDDERGVRNSLKDILEYEGYEVALAPGAKEGIQASATEEFNFVLCDAKYCAVGEDDIFKSVRGNKYRPSVLVTSRDAEIDSIVEYIKRGATDFLEKPIDLNRLLGAIRNNLDKAVEAEEKPEIKSEPENLIPQASRPIAAPHPSKKRKEEEVELTGNSEQISRIKRLIDKVAPSMARVLITGSNGTGKEIVAKLLHEKSTRNDGPFVEVNCAAIPSELIESELFGHEKGAFTSAIKQRKGKFEQADGGTLFLDEIGDMSLSAQAKVLHALQENRISRVGGDKSISVNVRFLAATNKDLRAEIEKGNFREDLFHRLSVIEIKLPSLGERLEDIPLLVDSFIDNICEEYEVDPKAITRDALEELKAVNWTGNVRQLRNVIERLIILGEDPICAADVRMYVSGV